VERLAILKPEAVRNLAEKLKPFLDDSLKAIPTELRVEIRKAYTAVSEALGRQGFIEGWSQTFQILKDDLRKLETDRQSRAWLTAAYELARAEEDAGEQFGVNTFT
jgi:hypothetical protein